MQSLQRMRMRAFIVASLLVIIASPPLSAKNLIVNGDFKEWADGVPKGWSVEVGARNGGSEPESEVAPLPGKGLMLRGNQSTLAWRLVQQELDVVPGDRLTLTFEARTKGVRREARQFNNCYVGLLSFDANKKLIDQAIESIPDETGQWETFTVDYRVPSNAASTVVGVFLSKSGLFGVQSVSVLKSAKGTNEKENEEDDLLKNGALQDWTRGHPRDWKVEIAAKNGADRPVSLVKEFSGGGVSLSGDARTLAWKSVSQSLAIKPGTTYTLQFSASASNVRRQGRQYDNCYVGVLSFDANDRRVDMAIQDLSKINDWKEYRLNFSPPRNARRSEVIVFLSKSGTLRVKEVSVKEATPGRPF